jgi:hypothetical protein
MTDKQCGPATLLGRQPGLSDRDGGERTTTHRDRQGGQFPPCELHGIRLVDGFPAGCPLSAPHVLNALTTYRDRGWERFGGEDFAGAESDFARYETCTACVARSRTHPRVQRLRAGLGVT